MFTSVKPFLENFLKKDFLPLGAFLHGFSFIITLYLGFGIVDYFELSKNTVVGFWLVYIISLMKTSWVVSNRYDFYRILFPVILFLNIVVVWHLKDIAM